MSSCFLCDTSYRFDLVGDMYSVVYAEGQSENHWIKYMPIMVGSSGFKINRQGDIDNNGTDQQHTNDKTQNYVSYRVKKIEFRSSIDDTGGSQDPKIPDYIILFKVPFREPVFDYYFTLLKNFILFSEPESVLAYRVCPWTVRFNPNRTQLFLNKYDLIVNKPFIVGPNDYVGVLYFFRDAIRINASARVWFDVV